MQSFLLILGLLGLLPIVSALPPYTKNSLAVALSLGASFSAYLLCHTPRDDPADDLAATTPLSQTSLPTTKTLSSVFSVTSGDELLLNGPDGMDIGAHDEPHLTTEAVNIRTGGIHQGQDFEPVAWAERDEIEENTIASLSELYGYIASTIIPFALKVTSDLVLLLSSEAIATILSISVSVGVSFCLRSRIIRLAERLTHTFAKRLVNGYYLCFQSGRRCRVGICHALRICRAIFEFVKQKPHIIAACFWCIYLKRLNMYTVIALFAIYFSAESVTKWKINYIFDAICHYSLLYLQHLMKKKRWAQKERKRIQQQRLRLHKRNRHNTVLERLYSTQNKIITDIKIQNQTLCGILSIHKDVNQNLHGALDNMLHNTLDAVLHGLRSEIGDLRRNMNGTYISLRRMKVQTNELFTNLDRLGKTLRAPPSLPTSGLSKFEATAIKELAPFSLPEPKAPQAPSTDEVSAPSVEAVISGLSPENDGVSTFEKVVIDLTDSPEITTSTLGLPMPTPQASSTCEASDPDDWFGTNDLSEVDQLVPARSPLGADPGPTSAFPESGTETPFEGGDKAQLATESVAGAPCNFSNADQEVSRSLSQSMPPDEGIVDRTTGTQRTTEPPVNDCDVAEEEWSEDVLAEFEKAFEEFDAQQVADTSEAARHDSGDSMEGVEISNARVTPTHASESHNLALAGHSQEMDEDWDMGDTGPSQCLGNSTGTTRFSDYQQIPETFVSEKVVQPSNDVTHAHPFRTRQNDTDMFDVSSEDDHKVFPAQPLPNLPPAKLSQSFASRQSVNSVQFFPSQPPVNPVQSALSQSSVYHTEPLASCCPVNSIQPLPSQAPFGPLSPLPARKPGDSIQQVKLKTPASPLEQPGTQKCPVKVLGGDNQTSHTVLFSTSEVKMDRAVSFSATGASCAATPTSTPAFKFDQPQPAKATSDVSAPFTVNYDFGQSSGVLSKSFQAQAETPFQIKATTSSRVLGPMLDFLPQTQKQQRTAKDEKFAGGQASVPTKSSNKSSETTRSKPTKIPTQSQTSANNGLLASALIQTPKGPEGKDREQVMVDRHKKPQQASLRAAVQPGTTVPTKAPVKTSIFVELLASIPGGRKKEQEEVDKYKKTASESLGTAKASPTQSRPVSSASLGPKMKSNTGNDEGRKLANKNNPQEEAPVEATKSIHRSHGPNASVRPHQTEQQLSSPEANLLTQQKNPEEKAASQGTENRPINQNQDECIIQLSSDEEGDTGRTIEELRGLGKPKAKLRPRRMEID